MSSEQFDGPSAAVRIRAMKRDKFRCTYCGASGNEVELEVDHIIARSKGGSHHISNLTTACRKCNQKKSDGEPSKARIFAQSASDFLRLIEGAGALESWSIQFTKADADDSERKTKVLFWLRWDEERLAWVEHAYGSLLVCLIARGDHRSSDYWFSLARLHENCNWSWQQQIREKNWAQVEHLRLLDALCDLIPRPDL